MFADVIKLFHFKGSVMDVQILTSDLVSLVYWGRANLMSLNFCACKKISFSKSSPVGYTLQIDDRNIESVVSYTDLDISLDQKINFNLRMCDGVYKKIVEGF